MVSDVTIHHDPSIMKVVIRSDGKRQEFTTEEWNLICRAANEDLWNRLANMELYIAMKDKPSK